jgi:hypothetical protein
MLRQASCLPVRRHPAARLEAGLLATRDGCHHGSIFQGPSGNGDRHMTHQIDSHVDSSVCASAKNELKRIAQTGDVLRSD